MTKWCNCRFSFCTNHFYKWATTLKLSLHGILAVHNENRPVLNCKHEGCKFKTRSTMSMTVHLRNKHLGLQRYFECEFCGVKLGAKTTYETHIRRHKGQNIFRCIKCPAAFPCKFTFYICILSKLYG